VCEKHGFVSEKHQFQRENHGFVREKHSLVREKLRLVAEKLRLVAVNRRFQIKLTLKAPEQRNARRILPPSRVGKPQIFRAKPVSFL